MPENERAACTRIRTDSDTHLLATHTIPSWSVIGLASLGVHLILPQDVSHALAALLLAMIAGVYVGFAALDGRLSHIIIESFAALLFIAFALWALVFAPYLLPIGYIAHAGWDFLHHTPVFKIAMPNWYIPACVVFDVVVGLGLWAIWAL
jgi:hypothetical protein